MSSLTADTAIRRGKKKNEGSAIAGNVNGSILTGGNSSGTTFRVSKANESFYTDRISGSTFTGRTSVSTGRNLSGNSLVTANRSGSTVTAIYKRFSSGADNKSGSTVAVKNEIVVTTTVPMKSKTIETVEHQVRDITVDVPIATSGPRTSEGGQSQERIVTVPAKEVKKITTVQEISPIREKTLVIRKLEPIVRKRVVFNKEITQVQTPLHKNLSTKTTVKRTTQVTVETKTIIGPKKDEHTTKQ